jgi:hypothetical protein
LPVVIVMAVLGVPSLAGLVIGVFPLGSKFPPVAAG